MQRESSLTGKLWRIRDGANQKIMENPDAILINLLRLRTVDPTEDVSPLTSPKAFLHLERAVERIGVALRGRESIGLFGDYDCDGVTSLAIVQRFFNRNGSTPTVRIPHRVHDGYGLTTKIVDEFHGNGITLIITTDNGVSAHEAIAHAKEKGIDVIVTDHHHVPEVLPDAFAILHPALSHSYDKPHPSGAGVALQLVRALEGETWEGIDTDYALAMIGTVADLVELTGDNRRLVQRGLASLSYLPPNDPLSMLVAQAGISQKEITCSDIAFRIAPRINAAGRMENPLTALKAITQGSAALEALEKLNGDRQKQTETLYDDILRSLPNTLPPLLFASDASYPEGIIGLLAGRLCQDFGRPSMVAATRDGISTASLRSVPGYHITKGLEAVGELFLSFGGHAQAAGCTFAEKHAKRIIDHLEEDILKTISEEDLVPTVNIDCVITPHAISFTLFDRLSVLSPFGQGNPEPMFLLEKISMESARKVGAEGKHLQGRIAGFPVIGFGLGSLLPETVKPLDIVCHIGTNTWNGKTEPQILIEDIALSREVRENIFAG